MTILEANMIKRNKGKKVTFLSGVGEIVTGYIQDGSEMFGTFNWQISKTKKPRSEFNLDGSGEWYLVSPVRILTME